MRGTEPRRLKIFISSPGDVPDERLRADLIIDKLGQDYNRFFRIESYRWEHEPMLASGAFQDAIEPPSRFDIVILILWSRLGTPLPERTQLREYRGLDDRAPVTGTEWEFEDALQAARQRGAPDILAFRNISPASIETHDLDAQAARLGQLQALNAFWQRHFADRGVFLAAYDTYRTLEEFADRLERSLRNLIERRVREGGGEHEPDNVPLWHSAPFRGLEAYEFEYEPIFFGRDALVAKAAEQFTSQVRAGSAFILVSGASGSGKSSLVKAALVPRLMKPQRIAGTVFLRRLVFRPSDGGADPLLGLIEALTHDPAASEIGLPELIAPGQTAEQLANHLRAAPDTAGFLFAGAMGRVSELGRRSGGVLAFEKAKLIIAIDQLEELFTIPAIDAEAVKIFIRVIASLARGDAVWVVATMRSDFWHRAAEIPELVAMCEGEGRIDVAAPSPAEIAEMIRKPAEAAALSFETDPATGLRLDAVLAEHATAAPGVLPLLSFTLEALYVQDVQVGGGHVLTHATYDTLGGLEGAIAARADKTVAELPAAAQSALPRVLRSLATVSDAANQIAVSRTMALNAFPEGSDTRALVDALIAARLLVGSSEGAEPTVRLAHEALINRWQRASQLLVASRRDLETRAMIERQQARWVAADPAHRRVLLLRDLDLATALDLEGRWEDELPLALRDYVAASAAAAKAATRRKQAVIVAVFLVLLAFAAASFTSLFVAEERRDTALIAESDFFARDSDSAVVAGDTTLATTLSLAALPLRIADPDRPFISLAEFSLEDAIANRRERAILRGQQGTIWSVAFSPDGREVVTAQDDHTAVIWNVTTGAVEHVLRGHSDRIWYASFSSDGKRIVTASSDKTARLWNADTGDQIAVLRGHQDAVTFAAFSPDTLRVVTASDDNTARLWDGETGALLTTLSGHGGLITAVNFAPDGKRVVTGSTDKTARIWDTSSGRQLAFLQGHGDFVSAVAFSPDGTRVLTASWDKTARLWDGHSGTQLAVLEGHEQMVLAAAFSSDGKTVGTGSADRTARLWNATTGAPGPILEGHEDWVNSIAFSGDGGRVLTASNDGTSRLWSAETGAAIAVLRGHTGFVNAAVFSHDDSRVATASYDGTARVWDSEIDASVRVFRGHQDLVNWAALSPDDTVVGTASKDTTARLWDAQTGSVRAILKGHSDAVNSIAFSPDGTRVVTASDDHTARLWDVATATTGRIFTGHESWVQTAAFSPDGARVVTASNDFTARIWNAQTGDQLVVLRGHESMVTSAEFSPDGKRVLTSSWDHTARIWDAATGSLLHVLQGHEGRVIGASFSPDGTRVITASDDRTARVWNASTGAVLAVLRGHDSNVTSGAFSPDGTRALTSSWDKTARVWDWATGRTIVTLRGHADLVYTAAFSRDGTMVVTGSRDGTARLWRLPSHCQALINQAKRELPGPPTAVQRARYFLAARPGTGGVLGAFNKLFAPLLPHAGDACR
jgi:WD40 repeat protein